MTETVENFECCVDACDNRSGDLDKDGNFIKFFKFPPLMKYKDDELTKLSAERRRAWKIALKIIDKETINQSFICSNHFISGCPSQNLKNKEDPDWIPSLNLKHSYKKFPSSKHSMSNEPGTSEFNPSAVKIEDDFEMEEYQCKEDTLGEHSAICRLCSEEFSTAELFPLFGDREWNQLNLVKSIENVLSITVSLP